MNDEQQTTTPATTVPVAKTNYWIPLSIVFGFSIVAAAIYFGSTQSARVVPVAPAGGQQAAEEIEPSEALKAMRPVSEEDHIKGDLNAPIKIVEYSDFECPFCKRFHDTMNQVMAEYGDSGEVAWVYRQFPLDVLHKKARPVSVASECVAELGGNDAFWQFTDRYYEVTLTNDRTDIETVIPQIVGEIGLDRTAFQSCFESGRHDEKIEADVQNAAATGGRGTPWSIIVAPDGSLYPINGAQPYESVVQVIEQLQGN